MVNQLLAGVHIAAAAEALAFSARLGLKTRELFELIKHTGGFSWSVLILVFLLVRKISYVMQHILNKIIMDRVLLASTFLQCGLS